MATTKDVLERHLKCFGEGDLTGILSDYAMDAVFCAAGPQPGLPICLAEGVTLKRDLAKDERILLEDVEYDPRRFDFDLYFKAGSS